MAQGDAERRSIDTRINDLRQEIAVDRERLLGELRDELRLLTRTLSHLRDDRTD